MRLCQDKKVENMQLSQKIKEARLNKGWKQDDLAKFSGVSLGSIKRYETNNGNITYSNLEKIANALGIKVSNFISLKDKKDVSQSKENLSPNIKNMSLNMSLNHSNLKNSQVEQIKNDQIYIRQLSSSVGAGESVDIDGIEIYDTDILVPFSQMLFKVRPKNTDRVRCMKVDGYSMVPMLFPDSWVIADVTASFAGDGLYIINYCGNFMVKLLQKSPNGVLHIKSVNKDYESYDIGPDDDVNVYIVGKVLRCVI